MNLQDIIQNARAGVDYGVVTLSLKIHDKELITVDTAKWTTNKVKDNSEALSSIIKMMKLISTQGETGHLTYVVHFKRGKADKLQVQDFKRVDMREL